MNNIDEFAFEIKKKKELSGADLDFVKVLVIEALQKKKIKFGDLNNKDKKILMKEIRQNLRNFVGRFRKSVVLSGSKEDILKNHLSTAERINFYPELKKIVFSLNISSILDLGCGLNPIALAKRGIKYYASDINSSDLSLVSSFFIDNKIEGKTFVYDLRKIDNSLPYADLVLIFKVLDIIEKKGHKLAEKIIKSVKCKFLLVSFPTTKISGKRMEFPKRAWFEKMLSRLEYKFQVFRSDNEIFYLVTR